MTLKEMCNMAAVYTDRRDDFVPIINDKGKEVYDPNDDPGIWFEAMKTSINTAYREVSRRLLMPDRRSQQALGEDGTINLMTLFPGVQTVKAVYSADGTQALAFDFVTKSLIRVRGMKENDEVLLQYHYVPEALESLMDEPEFPESLVDPMVYIALACADLWRSERKIDIAQVWINRYYSMLSSIKTDMKSTKMRRMRRAPFR